MTRAEITNLIADRMIAGDGFLLSLSRRKRDALANAMAKAGVETSDDFDITLAAAKEAMTVPPEEMEAREHALAWLRATKPEGIKQGRYESLAEQWARGGLRTEIGFQFAMADMLGETDRFEHASGEMPGWWHVGAGLE